MLAWFYLPVPQRHADTASHIIFRASTTKPQTEKLHINNQRTEIKCTLHNILRQSIYGCKGMMWWVFLIVWNKTSRFIRRCLIHDLSTRTIFPVLGCCPPSRQGWNWWRCWTMICEISDREASNHMHHQICISQTTNYETTNQYPAHWNHEVYIQNINQCMVARVWCGSSFWLSRNIKLESIRFLAWFTIQTHAQVHQCWFVVQHPDRYESDGVVGQWSVK